MKIDEPHLRLCFDCGTTNEHQSRVTPGVLCPKCGSQDTRHIPTRTKPMTVAELLAHEGDSPTELAMQAAIRDLVSRVEASQLTWTDAKPTREGWYWWRAHVDAPRDDWSLVDVWERQTGRDKGKLVTRNFGFGCLLSEWHGQFAGPIPPPTDTITPSAAPSRAAER